MAYVGKNPNFNTTILDNQGAGGVSNAPTGKVKLINRDGQILTKDDAGNESTLGGGGLEVVYETGPTFTAEAGKHYRCTSAVTGVTMPEITADIAQIAFSPSEGAEWSTNAITVTPHSSQYIDRDNGSVADETFKLNMSGVDTVTMTSKFSTLNWEVDTPITPTNIGNGAIVTDWESYTPTTQGLGTISNVNLQWRRNGTNIEVVGDFTFGTVTAVEAQIGLPNNYTIALGGSGTKIVGHFLRDAGSVANPHHTLATNGDTYFNIGTTAVDSNFNPTTPQDGNTLGSSIRATMTASVPVAEFAGSGTTLTASDFSAKTRWVDDTVLQVLSASSSLTDKTTGVTYAEAFAYRDSDNNYSLRFRVKSAIGGVGNMRFAFTGVTLTGDEISFDASHTNGTRTIIRSITESATNNFLVQADTPTGGDIVCSGDIQLAGKPSWFDDYAEASFDMDLHFQEATPSVLGLTKVLDEDDLVSDSDAHVPTQQSVKAYVDNTVESGTWTPTTASTSGTVGTITYPEQGFYTKVGNVVTCGLIINTTGWSEAGRVRVTLPVDRATNFPNAMYASGAGEADVAAPTGSYIVVAQSGAKNVDIHNQYPGSSGSGNIHCHFSYRLD